MKTRTILLAIFLHFTFFVCGQGTWTQKAPVGGTAKRFSGVGFSIGTKGYIGSGVTLLLNDFWEWDQATNVWTQKANFTGGYRLAPSGFSIGTKGYICVGSDGGSVYYNNLWEWNQATNIWTQKALFPGPGRELAMAFSVGTKGYIGAGQDASTTFTDFWEWDQATNAWTQKTFVGGLGRVGALGFAIGNYGYMGSGAGSGSDDLWEWNPATSAWTQKATNTGASGRMAGVGFSIGSKGYVGTGLDLNSGDETKDFWEWDQATNAWTQKANFGGTARTMAVGFSIGTKGYLGTGRDTVGFLEDFWEFDPNGSGVNEMDLSDKISVYPNPSNGTANVVINSPMSNEIDNLKIKYIDVFNSQGEQIYSTANSQIDLTSQPSGIYFVRTKTEQGGGIKKLVIQR